MLCAVILSVLCVAFGAGGSPLGGSSLTSLASQAVNVNVNESPQIDDFFATAGNVGALNFHESQARRFPEFEAASPFGAANTMTRFESHFSPTGVYNRARFTSS